MERAPSKSEIRRERWLRGRLDYKLHAGQLLIQKKMELAARQLFVGNISRQFGKSYLLVKQALETGFKIRRAKIKYGTAFLTDLQEFILPAFEEILQDCPEDLRPVWKSQKSKFIFPHNRSEIKLVGLDRKPNGLRGNTTDLIILDEAGFMKRLDYIYKSVIIPATTHRPNCKILVFSTPPETPAHEFLDYVQKAEFEGGYVKLTIYDNPMLGQKDITRLMYESGGAQSTTWRREYLCEFVTDANLAIIANWNDVDGVKENVRDEFFQFYHRYHAMDLGVRDNTASILAYYDFKQAKLICEDEFVMNGPMMNTHNLQGNLKRKELELWSGQEIVRVKTDLELLLEKKDIEEIETEWKNSDLKVHRRVSDNNNPLMNSDLSALHHFHFIPTTKERLQEMVNTLKILVKSGSLQVHPRCRQLAGCLKYGVWDNWKDQFAQSLVYGHFDALAALIYLVRNLDQVTDPIPRDYKLDPDNELLFPWQKEKAAMRNLKKGFGLG